MTLKNAFGDIALDDNVTFLRRLLKLLEPIGNVDIANRQRVTIDAAPATLTANVGTVTVVTNITALAGLDQRQFHDTARIAYNTGVRAGLIFS